LLELQAGNTVEVGSEISMFVCVNTVFESCVSVVETTSVYVDITVLVVETSAGNLYVSIVCTTMLVTGLLGVQPNFVIVPAAIKMSTLVLYPQTNLS
jgi:hypothetical protein